MHHTCRCLTRLCIYSNKLLELAKFGTWQKSQWLRGKRKFSLWLIILLVSNFEELMAGNLEEQGEQQGGEWLGPDSVRSCKTDEAGTGNC